MDYTQDYRWRDISFHLWHSSSLCHFLSLSPHNIPSFSALLSHTSTALTLYFTPSLDSTCHLSLFLSPPTLPNYLSVPLSHTRCLCAPSLGATPFCSPSLLSTCVFLSFSVTPFSPLVSSCLSTSHPSSSPPSPSLTFLAPLGPFQFHFKSPA